MNCSIARVFSTPNYILMTHACDPFIFRIQFILQFPLRNILWCTSHNERPIIVSICFHQPKLEDVFLCNKTLIVRSMPGQIPCLRKTVGGGNESTHHVLDHFVLSTNFLLACSKFISKKISSCKIFRWNMYSLLIRSVVVSSDVFKP